MNSAYTILLAYSTHVLSICTVYPPHVSSIQDSGFVDVPDAMVYDRAGERSTQMSCNDLVPRHYSSVPVTLPFPDSGHLEPYSAITSKNRASGDYTVGQSILGVSASAQVPLPSTSTSYSFLSTHLSSASTHLPASVFTTSSAPSTPEPFIIAIASLIEEVIVPLSLETWARADDAVKLELQRDSMDLATEICPKFSGAAKRVMMELHAGSMPREEDLDALEDVTTLPDKRSKGLYLEDNLPCQKDGGNSQPATRRLFYGGIANGDNGGKKIAGLVKRALLEHLNQKHRLDNRCQHYLLCYGDPQIARSEALPIEPVHERIRVMAYFNDEDSNALRAICESVLLLFCHLSTKPSLLKFLARIHRSPPQLDFTPTNVMIGLEAFASDTFSDPVAQSERGKLSGIADRTRQLKAMDPEQSLRDRGLGGKVGSASKRATNARKLSDENFVVNTLVGIHRNETFLQVSLPAVHVGGKQATCPRLNVQAVEKLFGFKLRSGAENKATVHASFALSSGDKPDPAAFTLTLRFVFPYVQEANSLVLTAWDHTYWNKAAADKVVKWVTEALSANTSVVASPGPSVKKGKNSRKE